MLHVCLSEYTVTDRGSILAVNKFCACTNVVKIIFKRFVSCNPQFQAFYIRNSTVIYFLNLFIYFATPQI